MTSRLTSAPCVSAVGGRLTGRDVGAGAFLKLPPSRRRLSSPWGATSIGPACAAACRPDTGSRSGENAAPGRLSTGFRIGHRCTLATKLVRGRDNTFTSATSARRWKRMLDFDPSQCRREWDCLKVALIEVRHHERHAAPYSAFRKTLPHLSRFDARKPNRSHTRGIWPGRSPHSDRYDGFPVPRGSDPSSAGILIFNDILTPRPHH